MLGYSVGHWEGDVFVVQSNTFDDRTWLDHFGYPHSDEMRLEERYHRLDRDNMQLVMTLTDPSTYTKPWVSETKNFRLSRLKEFAEELFLHSFPGAGIQSQSPRSGSRSVPQGLKLKGSQDEILRRGFIVSRCAQYRYRLCPVHQRNIRVSCRGGEGCREAGTYGTFRFVWRPGTSAACGARPAGRDTTAIPSGPFTVACGTGQSVRQSLLRRHDGIFVLGRQYFGRDHYHRRDLRLFG